MNLLPKLAVGLALIAGTTASQALNYDPTLPAPAPVLDAGWASDQIDFAWTDSLDSPYVYASLPSAATFTITDDFIVGDNYKVWDFGTLILTTGLTAGGQPYGGGVGGPSYQWGSVLLSAGAHSLTVQGDGVGGLPAGFYTRLDTAIGTPDGGSTMALLGGAMLLVGTLSRRLRV